MRISISKIVGNNTDAVRESQVVVRLVTLGPALNCLKKIPFIGPIDKMTIETPRQSLDLTLKADDSVKLSHSPSGRRKM